MCTNFCEFFEFSSQFRKINAHEITYDLRKKLKFSKIDTGQVAKLKQKTKRSSGKNQKHF